MSAVSKNVYSQIQCCPFRVECYSIGQHSKALIKVCILHVKYYRGIRTDANFFLMHSLYISVPGLKEGIFPQYFPVHFGLSAPLLFLSKNGLRVQLSQVLILLSMLLLCFEYLFLNLLAFPIFFSSSPLLLIILA